MSDAIQAFQVIEKKFENLSASTIDHILREMDLIGTMLVGAVRDEKLSGQVLKERKGDLKRGVFSSSPTMVGETVQITLGVRGVPYAGIQEHGGTVSIPEYFGKRMKFRAASGDLVFTRRRRAYTVTLPERSYIRSTVDEKMAEINARLEQAVLRSDSP